MHDSESGQSYNSIDFENVIKKGVELLAARQLIKNSSKSRTSEVSFESKRFRPTSQNIEVSQNQQSGLEFLGLRSYTDIFDDGPIENLSQTSLLIRGVQHNIESQDAPAESVDMSFGSISDTSSGRSF